MLQDDPFMKWLRVYHAGYLPKKLKKTDKRLSDSLKKLERSLDISEQSQTIPDYEKTGFISTFFAQKLAKKDVERAQKIYFRVFEQGGNRSTFVQENLLDLIGQSADSDSISFWKELIDFVKPRDHFAKRRKDFAVAALAFLLYLHDDEVARDLLIETLDHKDPRANSLAAEHLGRAYLVAQREPPPEVVEALQSLLASIGNLETRFHALLTCRALDIPTPKVESEGSYVVRAWLRGEPNVYRDIEVGAIHSFDILVTKVLDAFYWDHDHLYSIFLSGKLHDQRNELVHEAVDHSTAFALNFLLGELRPKKGQKFIFYYDYGDSNVFWLKVIKINKQADKKKLPRIVDGKGPPPRQYYKW